MSLPSASPPSSQSYLKLLDEVSKSFLHSKKENGEVKSNKTPADISKIFMAASKLPYSPDIESLRGWCLQKIRKYQLGLHVYDQILARFPMHSITLRRKGELLKIMGKESESQQFFKIAHLLEPDNLHIQILMQVDDIEPQMGENNKQEKSIPFNEKESESESEQDEKSNIWRMRIKSIDRPPSHVKSAKSVIFKSNLLEQQTPKKQNKPLSKRTSILKSRSDRNSTTKSTVVTISPAKSDFNVTKIKSIDGKMSICKSQKQKQILFCCDNENLKPHSSSLVNLKRKSSFGVSKFNTIKQILSK